MSVEQTPSSGDRLASGFLTFIKVLVRLLVIVILVAAIVAVIFFAAPRLYNRYISPLQVDINSLEDATVSQEIYNQQLSERLDSLQKRIVLMETQSDNSKQAFSDFDVRVSDIEEQLDANEQALQRAEATASAKFQELEGTLEEMQREIDALGIQKTALESDLAALDGDIAELIGLYEAENAPVSALRRDLQLVKAMELLTRASFALAENNLGVAQDDIQTAHAILVELQPFVPDNQQDALAEIIERLDKTISNLPHNPVLAAIDIEIAWQLLRMGLPAGPALTSGADAVPPSSPTPKATLSPTPTPSS
jgi:predicted  nucleic acid-binding Zn-ribbon protein